MSDRELPAAAPGPEHGATPATATTGHATSPLPAEAALRADMTAAGAGRTIIAYHLGRLLAAEQGTVEGRDPEALHEMRVATRRLRAALRVFRDAYDGEHVPAIDGEVRWLAGLLGRVRDLDVLTEALTAYERQRRRRRLPPLSWMLAEVQVRHAGERLALLEALGSARYPSLKRSLAQFSAEASGSPGDEAGDGALHRRAERDIRRQLRSVRRAGKRATTGRSEAMHALRIAAKRLRYTMEFYRGLFPPELDAAIEAATAVQDHLGSWRDAEVQADRMRAIAAEVSPGGAQRRALDGFLRHLRRSARREHRAFEAAYPSLTSKKAQRALRTLLRDSGPGGAGVA